MEKEIKDKIRNLWRKRLLISVTGLIVLGFSALQLKKVLAYRSTQPAWVLELSYAVRVLTNTNNKSNQEQEDAILELQRIAQAKDLPITTLLKHLNWKNVEPVDRDQNWQKTQEIARARARKLALKRVQDLELVQERQHSKEQEKTQLLIVKRDRAIALERALALAIARHQPLNHNRERELAQDLTSVLNQNRESDQAMAQGLRLKLINNTLFTFIIAAELEQKHGFVLQKGNNLDNLLSSTPNRTQVLMQSIFLLASSLLVVIILLILLSTYQSPLELPRTAHLIALLPEEVCAELGYLKQRLQQKNVSPWEIRKQLTSEILTLFFTYYIQVQLENLFLPSGDTIDD